MALSHQSSLTTSRWGGKGRAPQRISRLGHLIVLFNYKNMALSKPSSSTLLIVIQILLLPLMLGLSPSPCASSSPVPVANFVFGDSLVDPGNNNYLRLSLATAKTLPNGIDFPVANARNPTGRFTNGLTIADIIALKMGATSFTPPFLAPTTHGAAILMGVNYGSGGGGILNNTGRLFVQRLSFDVQISYFEQTVEELSQMLGASEAMSLVSKAIFSVTLGANDFLDNYLQPIPNTLEFALPVPAFIAKLITRYRSQLTRLYNDGARKFVIVNVPLIGCIPYQRSLQVGKHGNCSSRANQLAKDFNGPLKMMLDQLNANLPGATFLYGDAYAATAQIIDNFQQYGFEFVDKACCGALGSRKGIVPCRIFINECPDRSKYFFWDPYHPTQVGNELLATEFFEGSQFISPMNVQQLIAL